LELDDTFVAAALEGNDMVEPAMGGVGDMGGDLLSLYFFGRGDVELEDLSNPLLSVLTEKEFAF
jgi:hypothetical protein